MQNFKSLSINVWELGLEPKCARAVRHNKAKFVKIGPELKSQEPLVTENTCVNINCTYIMKPSSHKITSLYI